VCLGRRRGIGEQIELELVARKRAL
jgi:hypothetical protein